MTKIGTKQLALLLMIGHLEEVNDKTATTKALLREFELSETTKMIATNTMVSVLADKNLISTPGGGRGNKYIRYTLTEEGRKLVEGILRAAKTAQGLALKLYKGE